MVITGYVTSETVQLFPVIVQLHSTVVLRNVRVLYSCSYMRSQCDVRR